MTLKSFKLNFHIEVPETFAEHLLKRRMQLGLLQKGAAKRIGVETGVYRYWESDRGKPIVQQMPGIIKFLGYDPYPEPKTIGERIKARRRELGLTQVALAKHLGIAHVTVVRWERGERHPRRRVSQVMEAFLRSCGTTDK